MAARRKIDADKQKQLRQKRALANVKVKKLMAQQQSSRDELIRALIRHLRHQDECCERVEAHLIDLSAWMEVYLVPAVNYCLTSIGAGGTVPPNPHFP